MQQVDTAADLAHEPSTSTARQPDGTSAGLFEKNSPLILHTCSRSSLISQLYRELSLLAARLDLPSLQAGQMSQQTTIRNQQRRLQDSA